MKEVTFSVQVKVKDVFCFLMHHANRGAALIINILITVGAIALLVTGYAKGDPVKLVVLVTLALLFTVINPIQLYGRAKKQVQRNPAFAKPLKYTLTEEGITMSQDEESQSFTWEDVFQIKEYRSLILVYTGRVYACIWPKRELKHCEAEIRELFRKKLSPKVAGKSAR